MYTSRNMFLKLSWGLEANASKCQEILRHKFKMNFSIIYIMSTIKLNKQQNSLYIVYGRKDSAADNGLEELSV